MAFETIEQWQVERRGFMSGFDTPLSPKLLAELPFRGSLQKAPSAIFAIVLHGLFLYFWVTSAFDRPFDLNQNNPTTEKTTMTMIELGNNLEEPVKPEPAADGDKTQSRPANPIPNEIETSIETKLPPEWSIGRIRTPRVTTNSFAGKTGSANGAALDTGGASAAGVYDPFAGAAPNRKPGEKLVRNAGAPKAPSLVERVTGFFGFGANDKISPDAFQALVQSLRRRLPRAKGSVELIVSIDGSGKVKSAEILGGTASAQVKFFVRNAVLGKRLASGRVTAKDGGVKLPIIRFG